MHKSIKLKYPLQNIAIVPYKSVQKDKKIIPKFTQSYLDKQIKIHLAKAESEFQEKLKTQKKTAYESGFRAAEIKYKKVYKQKYHETLQNLHNIFDALQGQQISIMEEHEQSILQLTIDIAQKIIVSELQTSPELILNILKKSMNLLSEKSNLRIYVNPQDWGLIKENISSLDLQLENPKDIEIISSNRLQPGGCRIESNAGSINADIKSQLNEIANQLLMQK